MACVPSKAASAGRRVRIVRATEVSMNGLIGAMHHAMVAAEGERIAHLADLAAGSVRVWSAAGKQRGLQAHT